MFEELGFAELTAKEASVWFGLFLGLLFGVLAEVSKFCFRRSVISSPDRKEAMGVWLTAFAFAILSTQIFVYMELIDFSDNRYYAEKMQVAALAIGGLLLGVGMVLTRGCPARVTVLTGTGNLRAFLVTVVFGLTVLSMLKGFLAPIRLELAKITISPSYLGFGDLFGGALLWSAIIVGVALYFGLRSGARKRDYAMGAVIGVLASLAWLGTGFVLYDEFDPIAMQGLGATLPWSEAIFWFVASSSIPLNFGCGLIGGMILGGFVGALTGKRFKVQGFESDKQTLRYTIGAVLMGIGAVLAGGCTVGSGLTGMSTLSFAAVIAVISIAVGGYLADRFIDQNKA